MPIAAVPEYLGNDFRDASPGLRFSIYLPVWTERADQEKEVRSRANARSREGNEVSELLRKAGMDYAIRVLTDRPQRPLPALWEKNDFAARNAWKDVQILSKDDQNRSRALVERQRAVARTTRNLLCFQAIATSPFTTGLGNEHPLENGFAFLNPYGLPYLPGSGVKGVLRQAARELAGGEWGEKSGWRAEPFYRLVVNGKPVLDSKKEPVVLSMLDVLFGRETPSGESDHVRGALSFWDVIPQIKGDSLMVEIMTPHQKHYYQDGESPHDSGQPTPISFLTVPPGSTFTFHVICDEGHLRRLTLEREPEAPDLLADGPTHWKKLLQAAFRHAFQWLGFGPRRRLDTAPCGSLKAQVPHPHGATNRLKRRPR